MRIGILALCVACAHDETPSDTPTGTVPDPTYTTEPTEPSLDYAPNVLILLMDDVGVDKVGAYGLATNPPPQPTIDALAADGVVFQNAWTYSVCSPSRSALLTGRYGRRTGATTLIAFTGSWYELPIDEVVLPEMLAYAPGGAYDNSAAGKWHMASYGGLGPQHPLAAGFDWHAGSPGNLDVNSIGAESDYFNWEKWDNGTMYEATTYATTDTVNDAIDRIGSMSEPWLMYVAFNAPHYPMHVPPDGLHPGSPVTEADNDVAKYAAMVEAMDTEIGRLLESMDPDVRERTTIFVIGDNGTPRPVITPPFDGSHGKQTPYEGGIRVPLIVSGAGIVDPGRNVPELVHMVDVFSTVAALASVDLSAIDGPSGGPLVVDGQSLVPWMASADAAPVREMLYGEQCSPNGGPDYPIEDIVVARDDRYKLLRFVDHDELYDLVADPYGEVTDLLVTAPTPELLGVAEALGTFAEQTRDGLVYDGPDRPPGTY